MTENYKRVYYKMSYYPPYKSSSNNIKVELDLTNSATKTDLNNIAHVDNSSFASKTSKKTKNKTSLKKLVLKTKLASDVITLENKIDTVDKKIPDISGLATKTSLTSYLQFSTFNSKVTEAENKIKAADIIAKSANTKANTIRSDLTAYAKKADVAKDITAIKMIT